MEKNRPKMTIEERAKQFMPFMAVSGLYEALKEVEDKVEKEYESKNEKYEEEC